MIAKHKEQSKKQNKNTQMKTPNENRNNTVEQGFLCRNETERLSGKSEDVV